VERFTGAHATGLSLETPSPRPWLSSSAEFYVEQYVEQTKELLGRALAKTSIYFSPQTIKLTTCRVAAAHPDLPLGAFARAAHWWAQHRPRIKVFSRRYAAKLETIGRHVLRCRSKKIHARTPVQRVELVKS
jgi:hypothetical protein